MSDVRGAVGEKVISSTGLVDLIIPGFGEAARIKGLICWYTSYDKNLQISEGQFHVYFAGADSTDISGNGALMGQGMVNENNLGTSDCYKYTDASGGPGELRAFAADESFSFAADTRFVLLPAVGGAQQSGPIDNGWRLNVTTLDAPVFVYFALIGGNDVEIVVKFFNIDNGLGTQTGPHELTDPPKILGLAHTTGREVTGGTFENGIRNGLGAFYWDGTNITQVSSFIRLVNGDGTPDFKDTISDTSIVRFLSGATDWEVQVSAVDDTNVTLDTISNLGSASNEKLGVMLISLPTESEGWVGTFPMPSAAGSWTPIEQPSFQPMLYNILATGSKEYNLEQEGEHNFGCYSYGIIDENLNQGCASFIQDGDVGTNLTTSTSVAVPKLVHSYYEDNDAGLGSGGVSDPTLMADIEVTVNPFSAAGVTFADGDVVGTEGGLAWGWAIRNGAPAIDDPKITGCTEVGCVLSVDTTCIDPLLGGGTFAFQWFRNGLPITGATGDTYTLTIDDVGAVITVEVTWNDDTGTPMSALTDPTPSVSQRTRAALPTPQGFIDEAGNRASGEVASWMTRVSSTVNDLERSGGTAERPTKNLYTGKQFFDISLGHVVYYFKDNWVDAAGNIV